MVWGVAERLPLKGFPEGRYRIVMRREELARVYVRTPDGIREFIPKVQDGHWVPAAEVGANVRGVHKMEED